MKIAIIGSGISGAILGHYLSGSTVYESSSFIGGRTASSRVSEVEVYDKGASLFRSKIEYIEDGQKKVFNFKDFLEERIPACEILTHKSYPNSYYPAGSMSELCSHFLSDKKVLLNSRVEFLQKDKEQGKWSLMLTNGTRELYDVVVLTPPVPQIISILKPSQIMHNWDEFIRFRGEYRSSLILTGIWRNIPEDWNEKIKQLPRISVFRKDEELEFCSIESEKYHTNSGNLIVTLQFSSSFSSKNLERWCSAEDEPLYFAKNCNRYFFNKAFHLLELPELIDKKPDILKANKWRYAGADFPLFESIIDTDSAVWSDYLSLCKKHNIWFTGDWIWGSKLIRCALGAKTIASNIIANRV